MYSVKLLALARADLQNAKLWYNKQRKGLGEDFKVKINHEIDHIASFPFHCQISYKNFRTSYISRFPYGIFYLVEEGNKQIIIIAILHMKRNPSIIKKRIDKEI